MTPADRRLEQDAIEDFHVRKAYARTLTRSGDVRGALLMLSLEPSRSAWLSVVQKLDEVSEPKSLQRWLRPFFSHWDTLDSDRAKLTHVDHLAIVPELRTLNLQYNPLQDLRACEKSSGYGPVA